MKGVYPRTKPTGFLHAQNEHVVTVESIGVVYRGPNKRYAERAFHNWSKLAQCPIGRATGKKVTHSINNEIARTN